MSHFFFFYSKVVFHGGKICMGCFIRSNASTRRKYKEAMNRKYKDDYHPEIIQ